VLDASSGSGAKLADYFFVRLNSKIIKMNFKAGDKFTDHGPNPILPQNQKPAILTVKKNKADMGVIFDGDGDRCIFIDERGEFVHPYYMNCLLSELILKKYKKTAIAMDARLRIGLSETIKKAQGQPVVCRSGYANLVKLMQEQKILFGCENSGHYFFNFKIIDKKSNYIFGDALMPILLVLGHLKENNIHLSEATAKFKKQYFISGEINYKGVSFSSLEKKLARKYSSYKSDDLDGLSIYSPDWFLNIRPSKTEPLIRLNMEAKNKSALSQIKKEVTSLLK
ncbi:MAG: hypothetical protein Q7K65_05745, partial [Candidatus Buchananbacteria bacterium]|nr:hypothetical protein [Candidatus Buchananbacteria bacterium]